MIDRMASAREILRYYDDVSRVLRRHILTDDARASLASDARCLLLLLDVLNHGGTVPLTVAVKVGCEGQRLRQYEETS